MTWVVALLGVFLIALGAAGIVRSDALVDLARGIWRSRGMLVGAVAFRVVFGVALILAAPHSRVPTVLMVLGIFSLVAAGVAVVLGQERLIRLGEWWASRAPAFVRTWGVIVVALGALLVWAVV